MNYFRTLTLALLFPLGLWADPPPAQTRASEQTSHYFTQACQAQWDRWKEKYAGGTPYSAENRLHTGARYDESILSYLLKGNHTLQFSGGQQLDLRPEAKAWQEQWTRLAKTWGSNFDRNEIINAYIAHSIRNNPESNLLIIEAGLAHMVDYYFDFPDQNILYTGKLVGEKTTLFSDDFYTFMNQLSADFAQHQDFAGEAKRLTRENLLLKYFLNFSEFAKQADPPFPQHPILNKISAERSDFNAYIDSLTLLYLESQKNREPLSASKLLRGAPLQSNVILFLDKHPFNDWSALRDLPDGKCLAALGYRSVTILQEGLQRKELGYSVEEAVAELDYTARLETDQSLIFEGKAYSLARLARAVSPKAGVILKTGKVQTYPHILSSDKFIRLRQEGFPVLTQGLEFYANDKMGDNDKKCLELLQQWGEAHKSPYMKLKLEQTEKALRDLDKPKVQ